MISVKCFNILIPSCLVLSLAACERNLDFDYHYIPPLPVVEGVLTENGADVVIMHTTPMGEKLDTSPIRDAEVFVTNVATGETIALQEDERGHYTSDVAGVIGTDYELTVIIDGSESRSECCMTSKVSIESLKFGWIAMPYDDVAVLQVAFADNNPSARGNCYWVRVYRNGEIYKWAEINDNLENGGTICYSMKTSRRDLSAEDESDALHDGDEVTVSVVEISTKMWNYLSELSNDSSGTIMFNGATCLGYFLAAETSSATIIYHPDNF